MGSGDFLIDGEGEREGEGLTLNQNLTPKTAFNISTVVKASFSFLWARVVALRTGSW